jgi:hypothetical protein
MHFTQEEHFTEKIAELASYCEDDLELTSQIQDKIINTQLWIGCFPMACIKVNYREWRVLVWFVRNGDSVTLIDLAAENETAR